MSNNIENNGNVNAAIETTVLVDFQWFPLKTVNGQYDYTVKTYDYSADMPLSTRYQAYVESVNINKDIENKQNMQTCISVRDTDMNNAHVNIVFNGNNSKAEGSMEGHNCNIDYQNTSILLDSNFPTLNVTTSAHVNLHDMNINDYEGFIAILGIIQ